MALIDWLIAARPTVPEQALHEHNNTSYQQHIAIFNAIRSHDPDAAEEALQAHLTSVFATWHAFEQGKNAANNRLDDLVNSIAFCAFRSRCF